TLLKPVKGVVDKITRLESILQESKLSRPTPRSPYARRTPTFAHYRGRHRSTVLRATRPTHRHAAQDARLDPGAARRAHGRRAADARALRSRAPAPTRRRTPHARR